LIGFVNIFTVRVQLTSFFVFHFQLPVYTNAGALQFSGHLPENTTTSVLKKVIPKAYALCPNCPIEFAASATEAPKATFSVASGAILDIQNAMLNLTAQATVPSDSPISELMVLGFNASCGLNFSNNPESSGDYIKPTITILQIHLVVESTNVGLLPNAAIAVLDPLVNAFLKDVAIPQFNKKFPGFPLPTVSGFSISDFLITTNDGYIGVGLDILPSSYNTPTQVDDVMNDDDSGNVLELKREIVHRNKQRKLISARATPMTANPPGFSGPGVIIGVGAPGLNKILSDLIPKIQKEVNGLVIPAMSGKASGIDYSINSITISGFTIGSSSLTFVQGKGLNLKLGGLGLSIPQTDFEIKKKVLFTHISCSGHFSGSLGNTGVNVGINVTANEPAGSPKITPTSTWTWGSLGVSVKLNNVFCKIIKDIASWFIGNINHKIEDVIKSKIPGVINNLINTEGNKILSDLVLSKKIDKDAEVNYYLTQNPTSKNDELSVYLSGEFVKPTGVE
jgi:hypothetical protein